MEQINKSNRCCATCARWMGQRNANRLGFAEVSSRMTAGRCAAKWPTETRQYQAGYTCPAYSYWLVLR